MIIILLGEGSFDKISSLKRLTFLYDLISVVSKNISRNLSI